MNATENIRQGIVRALEERGLYLYFANEYGEPGYTTDKPILLSDWNKLEREELWAVERYFQIEWSDEWIILYDEDCKAYRTEPDCYGWQPAWTWYNDEPVSWEWIIENELADYVKSELTDNPLKAINSSVVGYDDLFSIADEVSEEEYESGWYGRNDNPEKILEQFLDRRHNMFFYINSTGQFSVNFQLWELNEENREEAGA